MPAVLGSLLLIDVCGLVLLEFLADEDRFAQRRLLWCNMLDIFSDRLGDGVSCGDKA